MILTAAQAQELGEALLDASDAFNRTETIQSVILMDQLAVAVPTGDHIDEWEAVVHINKCC